MTSPTKPSSPKPRALLRHLRPTDLKAAAQLATQATQGVVNMVEGVHRSVHRQMGLSTSAEPDKTSGITGQIYRGIRGVAALVGKGSDAVLGALLPLLDDPTTHPEASPQRDAVLAALNGVMGDRLVATGNPLAQAMELRVNGQTLALDAPENLKQQLAASPSASLGISASPHLLLLIHGLCMNDTQWTRDGHDHGAYLAQALGCTPVYLRYNSGRHVSQNGRNLSQQLEQLVAAWPVPLERITLVGHSMGGLVARSAIHLAREAGQGWPTLLHELVFLGTPHHGAPLERAGHGVDVLLGATPFSAPFVKLGQLRSAGITDLRHGYVTDADWQSAPGEGWRAGFEDRREPLPLPDGVACFAVAATLARQPEPRAAGKSRSRTQPERADKTAAGLAASVLATVAGDGMVPVESALGQHTEARRRLVFARDSQRIVYQTGHLDLLSSPVVAEQLLAWLAAAPSTAT
jgi:pimeloyl-ACP methyl ester carboxylesterase